MKGDRRFVAFVARDCWASVVALESFWFVIRNAEAVEARAIVWALKSACWRATMIEPDAQVIVRALNSNFTSQVHWESDPYVRRAFIFEFFL